MYLVQNYDHPDIDAFQPCRTVCSNQSTYSTSGMQLWVSIALYLSDVKSTTATPCCTWPSLEVKFHLQKVSHADLFRIIHYKLVVIEGEAVRVPHPRISPLSQGNHGAIFPEMSLQYSYITCSNQYSYITWAIIFALAEIVVSVTADLLIIIQGPNICLSISLRQLELLLQNKWKY